MRCEAGGTRTTFYKEGDIQLGFEGNFQKTDRTNDRGKDLGNEKWTGVTGRKSQEL